MDLRVTSSGKAKQWVAAINDAGIGAPEGWCCPHRFSSFAPPRGLNEDGSQAQWFVDGKAAFEAIASSIEKAKSEVHSFLCLLFVYVNPHLVFEFNDLNLFLCRYSLLAGGSAQSYI